MRGDLDETLARLARREEAQRRRAPLPGEPAEGANRGVALTGPDLAGPDLTGPDLVGPYATGPDLAEPYGAGPDLAEPYATGPDMVEPTDPRAGHGAYRLRGGETPPPPRRDPVEEVAEALRRVVADHPGLAVTVRVERGNQAYPLRVSWAGPTVTVGPVPAPKPPPAWPMSVKTVVDPGHDPVGTDPAARLAEMIRRDPSLLENLDPH
ncbi:hypothetical protein O7602_01055 [Micromonospora sp. WMMD1128]|uniref:hypothetical protein n=1 Tax=Micromonospora sp. WMMD1128 TaxID=3015150 RepID=UPI00248BA08D|nr:hypothetical protein [Micromonospora sp. WMMD1128]WBB74183.1 hypothetical protein O7602_01055 [Micromonospora sp. WMMD1128]